MPQSWNKPDKWANRNDWERNHKPSKWQCYHHKAGRIGASQSHALRHFNQNKEQRLKELEKKLVLEAIERAKICTWGKDLKVLTNHLNFNKKLRFTISRVQSNGTRDKSCRYTPWDSQMLQTLSTWKWSQFIRTSCTKTKFHRFSTPGSCFQIQK